jgi:hypothetical protein
MAKADSNRNIDRNRVGPFLLGAGLGVAAVLLLAPELRSRLRCFLDDAVAGLGAIRRRESDAWRNRKHIRRERTLDKKIDRMRSAGL